MDGRLIASVPGEHGPALAAFDVGSGDRAWTSPDAYPFPSAGVLLATFGNMDHSAQDGTLAPAQLARIDVNTGTVLWRADVPDADFFDNWAFSDGTVAYDASGGKLTAVDMQSGKSLWHADSGLSWVTHAYPLGGHAIALVTKNAGAIFDTDKRTVTARVPGTGDRGRSWGVSVDSVDYAVVVPTHGATSVLGPRGVYAKADLKVTATDCQALGDNLLCLSRGSVTAYSVPTLQVRWSAPVSSAVAHLGAATPWSVVLVTNSALELAQ